MIGKTNNKLSIRRQCDLFSVNRSRLYYVSMPISQVNLSLMNRIDEEFTAHPFTGVDRMVEIIRRQDGLVVNHKRIRRLMRKMGLMAIYPKPRTTQSIIEHAKYPCLIRKLNIDHANQVWCSDITYIRMLRGFMYLVAIMDHFSRYVLSWSVSNSLESLFCLDALDEALRISTPEIFHSDQGKQYTCGDFTEELKKREIAISMSGKGRCFDNILAERIVRQGVLWRKSSFGTQSERGARYVERILTTCATCRLQGRSIIEYLRDACRCHLGRLPAPSLINTVDPLAKSA